MLRGTTWGALRPYLLLLAFVWALPAMAAGVVWLVADKETAGNCEGIGFGCTPAPADVGWLMLALAAPVLFPLGLVGLVAIALVRHRRRTTDDHGVG